MNFNKGDLVRCNCPGNCGATGYIKRIEGFTSEIVLTNPGKLNSKVGDTEILSTISLTHVSKLEKALS